MRSTPARASGPSSTTRRSARDLGAAAVYYFRLLCGLYLLEVASGPLSLLPRRLLRPVVRGVFYEGAPRRRRTWPTAPSGCCWHRHPAPAAVDALAILALLAGAVWAYGDAWPLLLAALLGRAFVVSLMDNAPHYGGELADPGQGYDLRCRGRWRPLVLNTNLHGTHHRHPNLPWTALPEAFRETAGTMPAATCCMPWRQLRGPMPLAAGSRWPAPSLTLRSSPAMPDAAATPDLRETARTYDRIAPLYDLLDGIYEHAWKRGLRAAAVRPRARPHPRRRRRHGLQHPVLPRRLQVVGIDMSERMLDRARERARELGRPMTLRPMNLLSLDFPDASFDTVSATFVLLCLPDELQEAALRELRRVTKPGGRILLLDYRRSAKAGLRFCRQCLSPWLKWAFAATFDATTERYLAAAGLATHPTADLHGRRRQPAGPAPATSGGGRSAPPLERSRRPDRSRPGSRSERPTGAMPAWCCRGGFHPEPGDAVPPLADGAAPARRHGRQCRSGVLGSRSRPRPKPRAPTRSTAGPTRVLAGLADAVLFPFGGPPHHPFQRWARRADPSFASRRWAS